MAKGSKEKRRFEGVRARPKGSAKRGVDQMMEENDLWLFIW